MVQDKKTPIDIGAEFTKNLYSNAKLVTNEVQPYYILHKDTIRAFLHEKVNYLSAQGRLLGLVGIEISLIASLVTATFNEWNGIKAPTVEAAFLLSALIVGGFTIKELVSWIRSMSACSVDSLTDELGKRGAVIESNKENNSVTML